MEKIFTFIRFSIAGGVTAALGALLLFLFVETLRLEKNLALFIELAIVLQFNYTLCEVWTWKDYYFLGNWEKRWYKYHKAHLGVIVLGQVLFFLMTIVGIPYMWAYAINTAIGWGMNFFLGDKYVFLKEPDRAG